MANRWGVIFLGVFVLLVCFRRTELTPQHWQSSKNPPPQSNLPPQNPTGLNPLFPPDGPFATEPLDPSHLWLSGHPGLNQFKDPGGQKNVYNPMGQNPVKHLGGQHPIKYPGGQTPVNNRAVWHVPQGQNPPNPGMQYPGQNPGVQDPGQNPGGKYPVQNPRMQYPQNPGGQNPPNPGMQYPQNPGGENPVKNPGGPYPQNPEGQNPVKNPGGQYPQTPGLQYPKNPGGQNPVKNPGVQNPQNPGGQNPVKNPGGRYPQNPGMQYPQNPGGQNPQNPGMQYPQNPGGQNPQNPGVQNPQNPGGQNPQNPGGQNPVKNPGGQYPGQNPGMQYPQNPGGQNPQNPGGQNPQNPGGQNPVKNPGGKYPQNPGMQYPQNPGGQNPQNPGVQNPQNPGGQNPQNPGGQNPQNPGGQNPVKNPGGQNPGKNPGMQYPQNPGMQYPQNPGGQNPQNPGGQNPQNPGGQNPAKNPGGQYPQNPGMQYPQNPGGQNLQNPGGQNPVKNPGGQYPPNSGMQYPQNPGGQNPQNPGMQYPQNPGGQNPPNPGGQNPVKNPGGQYPPNPGMQYPPNPGGQNPQNPGVQNPQNPGGQNPVKNPTGQNPVENSPGQNPVKGPGGQNPVKIPDWGVQHGNPPLNHFPDAFVYDHSTKHTTNPDTQYPTTPFNRCDVYTTARVPCGRDDISAEACEALQCCYNGGMCYFGKTVTVQCTKDAQFIVVVARDATLPSIDLETFSLLGDGPGCMPVDSNSVFAIYQFPVTTCGTVVTEEPGMIIYENRMTSSYEVAMGPLGAITRDSSYDLLFQCRYRGTSVETIVAEIFQPHEHPAAVFARGPISVQLRLGNGRCLTKGCDEEEVAYNSYYVAADYPVTRILRDPVYVEVQLMDRSDANLVLNLGRCWTTTSENPHSLPQWDILIDGCPNRDDRYTSSLVPVGPNSGLDFPRHYRRFSFQMFTFVDPNSLEPQKEQVYIHCSTSICNAGAGFSCEPNCLSRRRRDAKDAVKKMAEPRIVASSGPLQMISRAV